MMRLFDSHYEMHKRELLSSLLPYLQSSYTPQELELLRIEKIDRELLSCSSGHGFVNRDILETLLGNLLESVAPGSHNAPVRESPDLLTSLGEIVDQLYVMVAQSFLAVDDSSELVDRAIEITFNLLWQLPELKKRAKWNRFASLKDPAVWDAYLLKKCHQPLKNFNLLTPINEAISQRNFEIYHDFLNSLDLFFALKCQMQLVMSSYPGWRVLFYHDLSHQLTQSKSSELCPDLFSMPVPLLPRAIAELAGRYYQADLHPETVIGDANFLDHPHRGITTGQTGEIGLGCVIYPCTLGGLSARIQDRHPTIGDFVQISTDVGIFGPVEIGDGSIIGANTEIYGNVKIGDNCRIGASVVIGTVKELGHRPGTIQIGNGTRIGDGAVLENSSSSDLTIASGEQIATRSHIVSE